MNEKDFSGLDIASCRRLRPYSWREYIGRVLWGLVTPLFRFSPRPFFAWRCFLLRLFGARIGRNAHIYPTARIYIPWNLELGEEASIGEWVLIYNLGLITIGERTTISHRAHLCAGTHDYQDPSLPLLRLPIDIGTQVWVCAEAFIGPGRQVGDGSIIGAAAVVVRDVPPWQIVAGNPAHIIKPREIVSTIEDGNG